MTITDQGATEISRLVNYVDSELRERKAVSPSMDVIVSNYIQNRAHKELAEEAFRKSKEITMSVFDVKAIEEQAKKELAHETSQIAVGKLKELYTKRAKAQQIVTNIDREIAGYLSDIEENATYEAAGVNVQSNGGAK
jgi:hypothetical protein